MNSGNRNKSSREDVITGSGRFVQDASNSAPRRRYNKNVNFNGYHNNNSSYNSSNNYPNSNYNIGYNNNNTQRSSRGGRESQRGRPRGPRQPPPQQLDHIRTKDPQRSNNSPANALSRDDKVRWQPQSAGGNENCRGNGRENVGPSPAAQDENGIYEGGPLNLAGHLYNPVTKKYFRIAQEHSGVTGYSRVDVEKSRRDRERAALLAANRPRIASGSFAMRPVIRPVSSVFNDWQIGKESHAKMERRFAEGRLLNCSNQPSYVVETPSVFRPVVGCEFLDASADGRHLMGCFAIANYSREQPQVKSSFHVVDVAVNDALARKNREEKDRREDKGCLDFSSLNCLGLEFTTAADMDGSDFQFSDKLVDMTMAPVDSDVTCVLSVVARDVYDLQGMRLECSVRLQPVSEISSPESYDTLSSPIYNRMWRDNRQHIWSVGWNETTMCISFGREENTRIENILTNTSFTISSRRCNVISQQFSQDGNLLFMGLRADDVIRADLRMNNNHTTAALHGSQNTGFLRILRQAHPECIVTENFGGKLCLWDCRQPSRPLLEFQGHQNSHYRLPCFIDANEKFIFAVGNDGTTRGWSLKSGDLLCAVPSPRPTNAASAHFPRAVFSESWGGRVGNAALVLAVGGDLRVHEMEL